MQSVIIEVFGKNTGMNAKKGFYVLLKDKADRTFLHSFIDM